MLSDHPNHEFGTVGIQVTRGMRSPFKLQMAWRLSHAFIDMAHINSVTGKWWTPCLLVCKGMWYLKDPAGWLCGGCMHPSWLSFQGQTKLSTYYSQLSQPMWLGSIVHVHSENLRDRCCPFTPDIDRICLSITSNLSWLSCLKEAVSSSTSTHASSYWTTAPQKRSIVDLSHHPRCRGTSWNYPW